MDKIKGKREGLRSGRLNTNKKVNRDLNFGKKKTGTGPMEGEPAVYRPTHHSLYGRPEGFKDTLDRAGSQRKTKKKTPNKLIPRKSEGAENFNPCSIKLSGADYTIDEYVHDPKQLRKKYKNNFDFGNLNQSLTPAEVAKVANLSSQEQKFYFAKIDEKSKKDFQ